MPDARPQPRPIHLSRRIVFLHIAKTAGTSIVHFFRRRLPEGGLCSHGDFLDFPREREPLQRELERFQFVSGHFGYAEVAALLPGAYSFTFLRDPVDRALSLYKFCLHPDMQRRFAVARAARDLGLEGFLRSDLPEVVEMLDNQQTWQLARNYWSEDRRALSHLSPTELLQLAEEHLAQFSRVGTTESFTEDFRAILGDLGIRETVPGKRQLRTVEPVNRLDLAPDTLDLLRERQALDYRLLAYARGLRGTA